MPAPFDQLRDGPGLEELVRSVAEGIADGHRPGSPLALIGVRTRGVPLAQRIADHLAPLLGGTIPVGAIDITLYRDDFERSNRWPVLRGTDVPFPVQDADIVLVDDVMHTGRTSRAALNAICDLGRPACVRLAVLVDRGGRELPIQPDVVGMTVFASAQERVIVRLRPADPADEVLRVPAPGSP